MMLKTLLLLSVAVATYAMVCPHDYCSKFDCPELTDCLETNGQRIREKGSYCNCCDICVKVLGEGERCPPFREFLGILFTAECGDGLVCDLNTSRCVRPGLGY